MIRRQQVKRVAKLIINLTLSLILVAILWISSHFQFFTVESEFRRIEKSYLLGPSDIIDIIDTGTGSKIVVADYLNRIVVGTIRLGSILYATVPSSGMIDVYEKTGDVTMIPLSQPFITPESNEASVLLVVDSIPNAQKVNVELTMGFEITINGVYHDWSDTYTATAERDTDGIFYLYLNPEKTKPYALGPEYYAMQELRSISHEWRSSELNYHAALKFYDSSGNLITEQIINRPQR